MVRCSRGPTLRFIKIGIAPLFCRGRALRAFRASRATRNCHWGWACLQKKDNHPGCSRQGSTFNVRLQSAIRCIPPRKGRRQIGVDEIQQLDHWWFCRGWRTKRGRVPSSRHGGRVRERGRVRAYSWFLPEPEARGESGSVPASQEGTAARASRRTRVSRRYDCTAHLSQSGLASDCAAIASCSAHRGGSGGSEG